MWRSRNRSVVEWSGVRTRKLFFLSNCRGDTTVMAQRFLNRAAPLFALLAVASVCPAVAEDLRMSVPVSSTFVVRPSLRFTGLIDFSSCRSCPEDGIVRADYPYAVVPSPELAVPVPTEHVLARLSGWPPSQGFVCCGVGPYGLLNVPVFVLWNAPPVISDIGESCREGTTIVVDDTEPIAAEAFRLMGPMNGAMSDKQRPLAFVAPNNFPEEWRLAPEHCHQTGGWYTGRTADGEGDTVFCICPAGSRYDGQRGCVPCLADDRACSSPCPPGRVADCNVAGSAGQCGCICAPGLHRTDTGRCGLDCLPGALSDCSIDSGDAEHLCGCRWPERADEQRKPEDLDTYRICTGLLAREVWGPIEISRCPAGYAIMGANSTLNEEALKRAWCCPLPRRILTEETELAEEACPSDSIAVGLAVEHERKLLRCGRFDTTRFRLADESTDAWVRRGPALQPRTEEVRGLLFGSDVRYVHRAELPPALRFGLGRISRTAWSSELCAGYPWGSVMVGTGREPGCSYEFRRLVYRGAPGDPPDGAPVDIVPQCEAIAGELTEHPRCVHADD